MIPNVMPATFKTNGTPTVKTNTPRRIIPTILKTSFASFIVYSPINSIVRSQLYADSLDSVPMKILNTLHVKMAVQTGFQD
jgi:hypothetical protein